MQSALLYCSATPPRRIQKNTVDAIMDARVKEVRFCWLYVMSYYTTFSSITWAARHRAAAAGPTCCESP